MILIVIKSEYSMLVRIRVELIDIRIVRGRRFEIRIRRGGFRGAGSAILALVLIFRCVVMCIIVLFAGCLLTLITHRCFMTIVRL